MRKSFTRFLSLIILFSIFSLVAVASVPVVTVSPASPATNVDPRGGSVTFTLTFDQNVLPGTAGAGVIALSNSSDIQLDPIQISGATNTNPATGSTVVINGKVVTVTFRYSPIPEQTTFYVTATADALKNAGGEYWAGWKSFGGVYPAGTHDYVFTTGDFTAPKVLTTTPFDPVVGSSANAINKIYSVTFDENIQPGTGFIQTGDAVSKPGNLGVYKANGDVVEIYDVTTATATTTPAEGAVGIVGSTLYINVTDAKVAELGKYYVHILNTALTDMSVNKNKFAGINNNTTWNFQLADLTPPKFTADPAALATGIQQTKVMKIAFTDNRTAAGLTFALQKVTAGVGPVATTVAPLANGDVVTSMVSFMEDVTGGTTWAATSGPWKATYTAANEITVEFTTAAKFVTGANYKLDVIADKFADIEKNVVVSAPSTFKAGDFTAPTASTTYLQQGGYGSGNVAPFSVNTTATDKKTTKIFFAATTVDNVVPTSGLASLPTSVKYLVTTSTTAPTVAVVLASGTELPLVASNTNKHQAYITVDRTGATLLSNTLYYVYYAAIDNATVKNNSAVYTSSVTTNDIEAPTYTVKYMLGAVEQTATAIDKQSKIVITFNEDVASNTAGTLFTPATFESAFTLKQTTPNVTLTSAAANFTVTKVSDKVFEINGTHSNWAGSASWMSKGNYTLAIDGSKIFDRAGSNPPYGTANPAASSTNLFSVKDYEGPTAVFNPSNSATDVNNNGNITITFSEAPYYLGAPVTQDNIDGIIELRKGTAFPLGSASTGSPLEPRTVTIAGNVVTITPTNKPLSSQFFYRASASTEITDVNGYKLNKFSDNTTPIVPASLEYSVFSTADNRTPLVTYTTYVGTTAVPAVQDNVARVAQGLVNVDNAAFPVILLDESVQEIVGNTPISSMDANQIRTLITFKKGDANGANVEFNVILASMNTGLTPPPTGVFEIVLDPINYPSTYLYDNSGTYYFSISGIQDAAKNPIQGSATFTVVNSTPLTLTGSNPANAATGIAKSGNIVLTFNQNISKTTTSGSFITSVPAGLSIDVTNAAVTVSGNQVTIPYSGFTANTGYTINVPAGVFTAVANSAPNAIITRTLTTVDEYGPTINFATDAVPNNLTPNAVAISNGQLSLTFTENIVLGNGYIKIRKPEAAGATTVADINVQSSYVTIDGTNPMKAKITIPVTLLYNQAYFVEIPQTAFKDAAGNNFQWSDSDHGILLHTADVTAPVFPYVFGNATWDFSTVIDAVPAYTTFIPAAASNDVALNAGLTINFSEPVTLATSGIRELTVFRALDNTTLETINLATAALSWNATMTQVTIPHLAFEAIKAYYINISPNAFKDATGNNIAALTSGIASGWYFTTQDLTVPTAVLTTASGAALTAVPLTDNLVLTFSEPVALVAANWGAALTLSTGAFTATLDASNKVLTINPGTDFSSLTSATLTIIAGSIKDLAPTPNVIAGSVITLKGEDKTPPVWFASYPMGVAPAYAKDKAKFSVALDEKSSVYYMTTLAGALTSIPTVATVKANQVYSYTASPFVPNAIKTIEITGLSELSSYDVYIMAEDLFGNQTGVSKITLYTTDVTAPTLVSLYPLNGAMDVNYNHGTPAFNGIDLKIRLSEKVAFTATNAKLVVRKYDTNVRVFEADKTSGLTISSSSSTLALADVVTVNVPKALLADKTQYYVEFEYDMVTDVNNGLITAPFAALNNPFVRAFIGKADWSFTTADETAPVLAAVAPATQLVPADNAIDVAVTPSPMTMRFSEPIAIGTGTIYIYRTGNASPQEVIQIPSTDVVVNSANNKELLITRHNTFASEIPYYIEFPATGVKDLAVVPNYYAGFPASATTWNFSTADITSPAVVWSPVNNATLVSTSATVSAVFVNPRQTEITGATVNELLLKNSGTALTNASDIKGWFSVTANGSAVALTSAIYTAAPATVAFTVTGGLKSNTTYVFTLNAPATLTDDKGNVVPTSTVTFSTVDNTSPIITLTPANTNTNVPVGSYVTVKFNKTIYNNNMLSPGTSINANFTPTAADFATGNYVTFKQGATNIPFTTVVVTPGVEYRLQPVDPLASTTVYDVVWTATRGAAQEVYDRLDLPTENKLDLLPAARTTSFTTEDVVKPTVTALNPLNNPLGIVNPTAPMIMTFSEKVQAGAGSIQIRRGNGQIFAEVLATDFTYSSASPWTVTIPHPSFEKFTTYYVIIPDGAITDASNNVNPFAGFADNTKWSFKTDDGTAPTISVFTPANGSNNNPVFSNLTMQFSENIQANAGNIVIYYNNGDANSDGNAIEIIPIGSPKVVISGSNVPQGLTSDVVTVDPITTFDKLGTFYVRLDAGLVKDFAATPNNFAGISNNTTWAFTVTDNTKPSLLSTTPVNNASGLGVRPTLTMTFDRNVMAGTGNIKLLEYFYNPLTFAYEEKLIETIPVNASMISGMVVTVTPSVLLGDNKVYYVLVDNTAITNTAVSKDPWAGISSPFIWRFTTGDNTAPTVVAVPATGGTNLSNTFDVTLTFNETVTGVTATSVTATGGTLVLTTVSATVYKATVTAADMATVVVSLSNAIKDANTNALVPVSFTYTVGDFNGPTSIATPATGVNMAKVFTVIVKFNEDVTGAETGITSTGGTAVVTKTTASEYKVVLTAAADNSNVVLAIANSIKDLSGNAYAGVASYTYTTGDNTAPVIITTNPNGGALANAHPANFEIFVSEAVVKGTGKLTVYKKAGDVNTMELDAASVIITAVGGVYKVTIPLTTSLDRFTDYYVLLSEGFVADANGNKLAAVTSKTFWTFKTGDWLTGLGDGPNMSSEFKVYPNPFVDFVTVDNASLLSKVVVTNIAGQIVKEVVNPTSRIQLNELRSGIYFMSMFDMDNVSVKTAKIVKR